MLPLPPRIGVERAGALCSGNDSVGVNFVLRAVDLSLQFHHSLTLLTVVVPGDVTVSEGRFVCGQFRLDDLTPAIAQNQQIDLGPWLESANRVGQGLRRADALIANITDLVAGAQ